MPPSSQSRPKSRCGSCQPKKGNPIAPFHPTAPEPPVAAGRDVRPPTKGPRVNRSSRPNRARASRGNWSRMRPPTKNYEPVALAPGQPTKKERPRSRPFGQTLLLESIEGKRPRSLRLAKRCCSTHPERATPIASFQLNAVVQIQTLTQTKLDAQAGGPRSSPSGQTLLFESVEKE